MAKLGRFAWEAAKGDAPEAPKVPKPENFLLSVVWPAVISHNVLIKWLYKVNFPIKLSTYYCFSYSKQTMS